MPERSRPDSRHDISRSKSAEGSYEAKALGHSIYTEVEDLEELRRAVKDAVRCHFEKEKMPHVIRLHLVKDEVLVV